MNILLNNKTANPTIKMINKNRIPKLYISADEYAYITELVRQSEHEVSWLSHITQLDETTFILDKSYVAKQKVHSATTEMTSEGLSSLFNEIIADKSVQYYNEIKLWGHSHVKMSPSPSGQDSNQIRQFNEHDYFIMLIVNKMGDIYVEFHDNKNGICFVNIPVSLYIETQQDNKEISDKVKEDIDKNVELFSSTVYSKIQPAGYIYPKTTSSFQTPHFAQINLDEHFYNSHLEADLDGICSKEEFETAKAIFERISEKCETMKAQVLAKSDTDFYDMDSLIFEIIDNLCDDTISSETFKMLTNEYFFGEEDKKYASTMITKTIDIIKENLLDRDILYDFIQTYSETPLLYDTYIDYCAEIGE